MSPETATGGVGERDPADVYGEAVRREVHGLIRPLWADMPEGTNKAYWRGRGKLLAERYPERMAAILERIGLPSPASMDRM